MQTFKTLSLVLIGLVLITACDQQKASEKTLEVMEKDVKTMETMEKEDAMMENEVMETESMEKMEKDDEAMEKMENDDEAMEAMDKEDDAMEKSAFIIEPYTAARFAALKGNTPVVINFHADWCPVCRALDKKLTDKMDELPAGTVMLKADFDNEVALKKELGITQQTTLVFFDASGEQIAKEYNPDIAEIAELLST